MEQRVPQVIGHRGAPGYRPENTLASFRLAIALGADAVETDVVMTADGVPVLRHERALGLTTDGDGLLVEELTLAELKRLRAVERMPRRRPRNVRWDGHLEVATLDELLLLVAEEARRQGRTIGVNLELKDSAHLNACGLPLEDAVLDSLRDHGLDRRGSGVVLQSFETTNLRRLAERTDLPLVQLVESGGAPADLLATGDPTTYDDLCSPGGLRSVATYAAVLGADKARLLARPELVEEAHLAGLQVTAWTVRDDDPGGSALADAEVRALLDAGVDGLFTDHPDTTVLLREDWAAERFGVGAATGRPA